MVREQHQIAGAKLAVDAAGRIGKKKPTHTPKGQGPHQENHAFLWLAFIEMNAPREHRNLGFSAAPQNELSGVARN
jgi:hypothetical protein